MTSQTTRDKVLVWHKRGYSATETARQSGLPLDEVMYAIEHPEPPKPRADVRTPEFIEPKFDV